VTVPELEQHFTTSELAAQLKVHPETIRKRARTGELRSIRLKLDRRFPESAVREWLDSITEGGDAR